MNNRSIEVRGRESRGPCRVMVVDDSAIARGIVTRTLEEETDIKVVASVSNGLMALKTIGRQEIDVVVLDIEMPELDGLAALPRLLEMKPDLKVIMVSSASQRDADISLKTMAMGAADYVAKPKAGLGGAESFRVELVNKVRAHGVCATEVSKKKPEPAPPPTATKVQANPAAPIVRSTFKAFRPDAIAIGSSTGGPQALAEVLKDLNPGLTQPILVTQHMPATFTALLGEHMTRYSGRLAAEARDGEPLEKGRIYIAPGGKHMQVKRSGAQYHVEIKDGPLVNRHKPSVDVLFRSVAKFGGKNAVGIIMTGMGDDGARGLKEMQDEGASTVAQDEKSCVVFGMPREAIALGAADKIMSLDGISAEIMRYS